MPLAEVVRSGFVEGLHRGSVVVLDAAGARVARPATPTAPIFPRSSNKPMQARRRCSAPACALADPADLALVCGQPLRRGRSTWPGSGAAAPPPA